MEEVSGKYVYHGSDRVFDSEFAIPRRNTRYQKGKNGENEIIFDETSFHATPHKWIALAYTYASIPYVIDNKTAHYNMGVSLYENNNTVLILGFGSLEESMEKLYGDGGYVYHFDTNKFITKPGLGNLEVIAMSPIKPVHIERIDDPIRAMKDLGVMFEFRDLTQKRFEEYRNYW